MRSKTFQEMFSGAKAGSHVGPKSEDQVDQLDHPISGQHEHTLSGQHDHPLSVDPLSATKQMEIVGSCSLEIGWSTGHPSNKPSGATGPGSLKAIWQKIVGSVRRPMFGQRPSDKARPRNLCGGLI